MQPLEGVGFVSGVRMEHVVREYVMCRATIREVDDVSFSITEGKYTIVRGASAPRTS